MHTICLTVEYDGTDLCGWQRQANGPTVQEHLERALESILQTPTRITGASRTDSGVHALGQVCVFATERDLSMHSYVGGLNSLLPPAIAVLSAREVPTEFNPRYDATGKLYRYDILARRARSPLTSRRAWHRPRPLELAAMQAAAVHWVGRHDFESLRASGCQATSTVRTLRRLAVTAPEPDLLRIEVEGDAFLRNMVRIIAGTLVEVGVGLRTPDSLPGVLLGRNRRLAGQTAPPQGLTLVKVFYDSLRLGIAE